jgi:TusA-related sulfurtransferase
MRYDLCGFICPLSKVKAVAAVDSLAGGETVEIVLGDTDSLKSVVQELKTKGIRPAFKKEGENRFVLTITKQEG